MKENRLRIVRSLSIVIMIFVSGSIFGQTFSTRGQASGWAIGNPERSLISQVGIRYIPEVFIEKSLSDEIYLDAEFSLNSYFSSTINDWKSKSTASKVKPHRLWARLTTNQFEARIGLQKINFGSALLFRPLMWFDRIDPRDPLKLTDGVYGMLLRYYFENNSNIWIWGLYGNKDTKGWELLSTADNTIEFGGRVQVPLFDGEAALTYHHREADTSPFQIMSSVMVSESATEDRFGFDGKWEYEIGFWFEGALVCIDTEVPNLKYQRLWTLGADYTFDINNGLNVTTEFFNSQMSQEAFGEGDGISFSGLSLNYPISILDNLSGIFYRDWSNEQNYYMLNWQRTYDNWSFYLIGFWNPDIVLLSQTQTGSNPFAGRGFQIMAVFNH